MKAQHRWVEEGKRREGCSAENVILCDETCFHCSG
jgi:hypothetical protein